MTTFLPHQEPTDLRVTLALGRSVTDDADHAHFEVAALAKMQLTPAGDLDPLAMLIAALPLLIRAAMRAGTAALATLPE